MAMNSPADQARELKREEVEEFRREALNGWAVECEAIVQLCDLALRSFQSSDELLLPQLATALRWCVKHDGECLGDHPDMLRQAKAALKNAAPQDSIHGDEPVPAVAAPVTRPEEAQRLGDAPGYAFPQDVQEWLWHLDTHLTEHDVRHAGLALRAGWPPVRDFFASMRGELIQLRNHVKSIKASLAEELQEQTVADRSTVRGDYENRAIRRCIERVGAITSTLSASGCIDPMAQEPPIASPSMFASYCMSRGYKEQKSEWQVAFELWLQACARSSGGRAVADSINDRIHAEDQAAGRDNPAQRGT